MVRLCIFILCFAAGQLRSPDHPSRRANIVKKGISPAGANLTRFSENDKYHFQLITIAMMLLWGISKNCAFFAFYQSDLKTDSVFSSCAAKETILILKLLKVLSVCGWRILIFFAFILRTTLEDLSSSQHKIKFDSLTATCPDGCSHFKINEL